jgi:hypothetical protein
MPELLSFTVKPSKSSKSKENFVKPFLVFLALIVPLSFAQGTISGTLYANEVKGFVIIGCLLDLNTQDCDYEKSPYVTIEESGSATAYTLPNAPAGNYLVIAWKDSNGNGQLEDDGQDEVGYYLDPNNEPALVSAPASNIDIRLTTTNPLASQPAANPLTSAATQPAQNTSPLGDLVGIWQMTRASGGDYKNVNTGFTFSMTSGFSTLLKIRANGDYLLQFYSSGVASNCAFASNFENSAGTVTYQGDQLILQPAWHTLELTDCDPSTIDKQDLGIEPIVYTFKLREEFDYNGLREMKLELTGGVIPFDMELLHRDPLMPGYQPKQPADFVLGTDPAYKEILGLWTPYPDSDINFYNPQTGEFYLPEYNGAEHSYLRFNSDGTYEMARYWGNYSYEGICEKDYIYYEKGTPTFAITEPPHYQGANVLGHAQFKANDARLVVNIRDCDEDTAVLRYNLIPQVSYYKWNFRPESNDYTFIPEGFSIECAWEKSEWQFMFCDGYGYSGRSYGRKP